MGGVPSSDLAHVGGEGDSRPVSPEDSAPVGLPLALEDDAVSGPLKSEVDSSDAREEARDFE